MSEEGVASPSITGPLSKLARAASHLRTLKQEIPDFLNRHAHEFERAFEDDGTRHVVRLKINESPFVTWSLIVGDFAQNLRAALDHLVWQLVVLNGRKPKGRTAFPILLTEPTTPASRKKWRSQTLGISDEALAAIAAAQPYNDSEPERHPLAVLHHLARVDRHRLILVSHTAIDDRRGDPEIQVGAIRDVEIAGHAELTVNKPLLDGAVVLRVPIKVTGPDPDIQIGGKFPFEIAFGDDMTTSMGLEQMLGFVNTLLVEHFAPAFFAASES